jgi:hypothetical protein
LFSNNSGLSVEVLSNTQGVFNILHSSGTVQLSDNTHFENFSRFKNFLNQNGLFKLIFFSNFILNFSIISSSFG